MNWPSEGSFPSAAASSSPNDFDSRTYPMYPTSLDVTSASPSQPLNHGLGISYGELDAASYYMRQYTTSEPYPADWTAPLMPSGLPSGLPSLSTTQISPAPFYDRYPGSDTSVSPLSFCGPPAMSATSSRGSALDYPAGPDRTYNLLPITPRSDTEIRIKEEADSDLQERPPYEYAKPGSVPLIAPMARYTPNGYWPKLEYTEEDDTSDLTVLDHDGEYSLSAEPPAFPDEMSLPWASGNNTLPGHRQMRVPPASGKECTICGAQFTRPSNCREHMKRHDPSNRKAFGCSECGKTLGRKTDLKRHIDSVHKGIRKFGCEHCGGRFSRQDTLARHIADGCRRGRKSSESKRADSRPPSHQRIAI